MAKILLVEDDNNLREIYEARLQAEGYTLVSAKDGEDALVMAKNEHPDLIISDVMMPKVSGFEMLDILRNTEGLKEVKIIMLTALGQSDDQQRADRLGADRYLVKSQVTLEDIVKVSHELLNDNPEATAVQPVAEVPTDVAPTVVPEPPTEAPVEVFPITPSPTAPPVTESNSNATFEPTTSIPVLDQSTTAEDSSAATSTAQEEAELTAKVDAFVASEPSVVPPETIVTATGASADTNQDANTQVITDAIDSLTASSPAPAEPQVADSTVTSDSNPEATPSETPAETPITVVTSTEAETGSVPIAHKKVISPIDADAKPEATKPDLNALLAIEEAKEAAAAAAVAAQAANPATDGKDSGDTPAEPIDPNNISL